MSGIEIAGLVLGAFPILIHALESYRESAEVLVDWWRIQRAYKKCKQDLHYHRILFEGNIERFLLPLIVDDDELKTLMADPAGDAWEDKELETRLTERLPKSYGLFLDIMSDINELMEALKKELGVNNSKFQASVNPSGTLIKSNASRKDILSISNVEFQAKRIKFSLKKSSRERLFSQLQQANDRMRNLLESNDHVTAARRRRETVKTPSIVSRKMSEFWLHAKRLHEALSKAWLCGCATHVANLQLQHRTSEKVEFDVLFHLGSSSDRGGWRETKIKMIPGDSLIGSSGFNINVPKSIQNVDQAPRQVHWGGADDPRQQTSPQGHVNQIKDLCSTLSTAGSDCFGFLDEDEHRFVLYPGSRIPSMDRFSTTTLDYLLQDAYSLTRRSRYHLALTLASSYLQLGATPWFNAPLGKDSIIFLQESSDPESILLDQPYIRREISKVSVQLASNTISSLGIRLLELCFGTPLENSKFRKQLPPGDEISAPILDYVAAIQWSRRVSEEAGPEFADAIEWCLHTNELSDGSWRKELWAHVIVPLDSCHRQVSQKLVVI
ncbi:hypothetical protein CC78DRAFT_519767 [Lojkania enalia]|uniref:DUF7580 domain-containing protein n=1 Tax=Lojkania enalia TaxID=147567 RepID=A0A9P4K7K7_9PLEO|nr:hypothetical protein CC78DRAFT_519767 [Didymosphaeria enalia]